MPTQEQLSELQEWCTNTAKILAEWKKDLALAKRAGFDVTDQETDHRTRLASLNRIKQVYGITG